MVDRKGRQWQPKFHDQVIRIERELDAIRNYIATNPVRWTEDTFHTE